jgi:CHAT domain-containing protein
MYQTARGAESRIALAHPSYASGQESDLTVSDLLFEWQGVFGQCKLVTLSACSTQTGFGLRDEGMFALPWGFISAGAKGVLGTQWPVTGAAAALLMTRFYSNLTGEHSGIRIVGVHRYQAGSKMHAAAALHEAKLWLKGLSSDAVYKLLGTADFREVALGEIKPLTRIIPSRIVPYQDPYFWGSFFIIGDP